MPIARAARPFPWSATDLLLAGTVAGVLGANAAPGQGAATAAAGLVLALACVVVGGAALRRAGAARRADLDFLAGMTLLAYALTLPTLLLGADIAHAALAFAVFGAGVAAVVPRSAPADVSAVSLLGLVAGGGFALVWSLETTTRFAAFPAGGVLPLALDATMFAGSIAELGDWRMAGRLSSSLADVSPGLYHFASFGFPALAVRLSGMDPLQAVPRVWIALGPLVLAMGLHALGRALAGAAGGALAVLLLAAMPDPAAYWLAQPFLSFHWLLEVTPGAPYAIGTVALSLVLLADWCATRRRRLLLASAVALALAFLLRAHIVLWAAIPWLAVVVGGWPGIGSRTRTAVLAVGASALPAAMLWLSRAEIGTLGLPAFLGQYLNAVHVMFVPHGYEGAQPWLVARLGLGGAAVPAALLALAAMGGLPLALLLAGAVPLRRKLSAIDLFPFALLVWACLLMLLAPTPLHGDTSEFRQRGFLLVVAALLAWNARWLHLALSSLEGRRVAVGVGACLAVGVTALWAGAWKAPRTAYFQGFRATPFPPGLVASGAWLRAHAVPGGSFVAASQDPASVAADDSTMLMALSGQPAWLSRAGMQLILGGRRAEAARARLAVLEAVAQAPDADAALALLCAQGVTFYVARDETLPPWDPQGHRTAFRAPGFALWQANDAAGRPCTRLTPRLDAPGWQGVEPRP